MVSLLFFFFFFTSSCQDPVVIPASRIDNPKTIVGAFNDGGTDGDLFIVSAERGELAIIDLGLGALIDVDPRTPGVTSIQVGLGVSDVAVGPGGQFVYAVNGARGEIAKVCTRFATTGCTARTVVGRISVPIGVERMTVAGARAYVTHPTDGGVVVVDLTTDTRLETISVGGIPRHVAINSTGSQAYVSDFAATSIARVDLADGGTSRIDVGARTTTIAITPDDTFVYVISADKPEIVVVDTATATQVNVNAGDPMTTDKGIQIYSSVIADVATPLDIAMRRLDSPDTNSGSSTLAYVSTRDGYVYVIAPGGSVPHRVVDSDTTNGPAAVSLSYSGMTATSLLSVESPRPAGYDAGTTGITFTAADRVLKPETIVMTYEAAVVGGSATRATLLDGGVLLDLGQHFVKSGVAAGDRVIFTGALSPDGGASCADLDFDVNGNRVEWPVAAVAIDRLTLSPSPNEWCYTSPPTYEVRAAGKWTVFGSASGRLARLTENTPYDNGLFALTMASGTSPTPRDAKWTFIVSTGVVNTAFKIGSLPRSLFYAAANSRLYVVDEASRSVVELDSATGSALRVFR